MWLHILVLGYYTKKEEGGRHFVFALRRVVQKILEWLHYTSEPKGEDMVRIWPLKKRKKEEKRKCALTEILLFHDSTQSTVQVQTFFFAPLFRQSNVQNREKLVYWSIWTTFWPAAASLENWQIKLILQHCISASLAHTQKVLLKLACAKKSHFILQSFFHCHF